MKRTEKSSPFGNRHPRRLRASVMEEQAWGMSQEELPNMRLSRAFIIVFLLHLLAVGGILAFHLIERNDPGVAEARGEQPATGEPRAVGSDGAGEPAAAAPVDPSEPVDAAPPAGSAAGLEEPFATTMRYLVQRGDTLTSIARRHGLTLAQLRQLNPQLTSDTLREQMIIHVPMGSERPHEIPAARVVEENPPAPAPAPAPVPAPEPTPAPAPAPTPDAGSGDAIEYTVRSGDNPYSIARKFNISQQQLQEANNIADPRSLQIGTVLRIPRSR